MNDKTYPELYDQLRSLMGQLAKESPGPVGAFSQLHHKSLAEGALRTKVKELMCLAIGIAVHCDTFTMHSKLARAEKRSSRRSP